MNILVLNGSPRVNGNTAAMVAAFAEGAEKKHKVKVLEVCKMDIADCKGCEYCHTKGNGECIQKDDMQKVRAALQEADMLVLASPIYYFGLNGQLQCVIHRFYASGAPKNLKKVMLILSSGSDNVYDGAIYEYKKAFVEFMGLENMGIFKAHGEQNKSEAILSQLKDFGQSL